MRNHSSTSSLAVATGLASASEAGPLGIYTVLSSASVSSLPLGHSDSLQAALPGFSNTHKKRVLVAKDQLHYPSSDVERRLERYALQSAARFVLPEARTAKCMRAFAYQATCVAVNYSQKSKRASYGNLSVCGSVWTCPVCASKVSERRRSDMSAAIKRHTEAGGSVYLLTRTFPHTDNDPLASLMEGLARAEKGYRSGRGWLRLKDAYSIVGTIRSVEATYGANGWHPHIHELVFTSRPISDLEAAQDAFWAHWSAVCARSGLRTPSKEHGLDIRDGTHAARYVSKWGLEHELAKWHLKKGRGSSLTPFDLLRVISQLRADKKLVSDAARLFSEYAEHFKGKKQLVWSRSLLDLVPTANANDEELATHQDDDALLLARITFDGWRVVLAHDKRAHLLEIASAGSFDQLRDYLAELSPLSSIDELIQPGPLVCPF